MRSTMRRLLVVVLVLVSALGLYAQSARTDLDALVDRWTNALINEDIETFMSSYWDDAVRISYSAGGGADVVTGMAQLRAAQLESFARLDFGSLNLEYDEPVRVFPRDGEPVYIYPNSRFGFMDIFEFEERDGEFRIVRQYLLPHPKAE